MMRTLRDMNMSKFVAEDVPLFLSLIDDLFPGLKAERSAFPEVYAALEKVRAWSEAGGLFMIAGAWQLLVSAHPCLHAPVWLQVIEERGLQKHPSWMNKALELYETYLVSCLPACGDIYLHSSILLSAPPIRSPSTAAAQVRHGIMVVGPAGSGKSTLIECLAAALTELGTKHVIWRMNPKAITAPQMFGRMDAATGVCSRVCCISQLNTP